MPPLKNYWSKTSICVVFDFQDERERQIGQIRDRVNRIKYERTMTAKEPTREFKKSFVNMAQEQPDSLSDDEKMQRIAKEMERKFKEGGVQSVTTVSYSLAGLVPIKLLPRF